jgi:pimeloyl-ACP methyl ester carboxylesterase
MKAEITPYSVSVSDDELVDLKSRLENTRWPEQETVSDWSQGAPLAAVRSLCDYWQNEYDWRRCENLLNSYPQFTTEIDGLNIYFLHIQSKEAAAMPLILTHGWPGSIIEFLKVIGPLTDPVAHGGKAEDAFHVVIPSLPGFGFSQKPTATGWNLTRIARAWITLMKRLGYQSFFAQGGDWGAGVTTALGAINPPECLGVHLNMAMVYPSADDMAQLTSSEQKAIDKLQFYRDYDSGYAAIQRTRPQTMGYGLVDSPVALAAWMYEKFYAWTDNDGRAEDALTTDEMLDNIMLYWLTSTGASSARLYWESYADIRGKPLHTPVGVSIFPDEIFQPSRRWAERVYSNIVYWNEVAKGGHFAAFEQPGIFVDEVRGCFKLLR